MHTAFFQYFYDFDYKISGCQNEFILMFTMYYISRYFYISRREMGDIMNYQNVNDTDRQAIYVDEDEPSITVDRTPWNSI